MVTVLNDKAIAVEIPPEGNIDNSYLWGSTHQYWVKYTTMPQPGKFKTNEIKLPAGYWEIVGRPESITEEQAKQVVEAVKDWKTVIYYDYEAPGLDYRDIVETAYDAALESFRSLLKSKSVDPEKVIILIKQQNNG
jgi:hypothetical protein